MSSRRYEVGDRVIIVKAVPAFSCYLNMRAVVISELVYRDTCIGNVGVHEIDPAERAPGHETHKLWSTPSALIPDYDGNKKVDWCDCVWRPHSIGHQTRLDGFNPQYVVFYEEARFLQWAKLMDPERWGNV